MMGMIMGWVSPAMPQLEDANGPLGEQISAYHLGWLASATFLVAFPAMLVAGLIADTIGRKISMLMASFSFCVS